MAAGGACMRSHVELAQWLATASVLGCSSPIVAQSPSSARRRSASAPKSTKFIEELRRAVSYASYSMGCAGPGEPRTNGTCLGMASHAREGDGQVGRSDVRVGVVGAKSGHRPRICLHNQKRKRGLLHGSARRGMITMTTTGAEIGRACTASSQQASRN